MQGREVTSGGRSEDARRRALVAKRVFVAAAVGAFAAGMLATRTTVSGHVKQRAQPLVAPAKFIRAVRRNALQAGQIAPAQAPPPASTSQS